MAIGPIFNNAFIAGWVNLMISALWQGSLILLSIWGIIRLFPRIHPAIQCWLWRLAYLKLLIAFLGLKPVKLYFHSQIALRELGWILANSHTAKHLTKLTQSILKINLPITISLDGTKFWFALWLTGLTFSIAGVFYLWCKQQKIWNSCNPVQEQTIVSRYQELGHRNNFRKMPRLFASERIHSPLLQGIIHPKIILPASMLIDFESEELRLILAHELAHYKRGDLFWNWLPVFAQSVFFFLPFVWRIEKKLNQIQEICCDRLAVQFTQASTASFGNVLFRVSVQPESKNISGLTAYYGSHSIELLKERLKALQSINPMKRRGMAVATYLLLIILGIAAVIPWQLVQAQTLPINLWINYPSPSKFEISAHVILPKKEIKATTLLIDDKQLFTTNNLNNIYFGYAKPIENYFPLKGPHKVTVKAFTTTGTIIDHNWIYFHDSMNWSNQSSGAENDKTVIKIGPFFWIINNTKKISF